MLNYQRIAEPGPFTSLSRDRKIRATAATTQEEKKKIRRPKPITHSLTYADRKLKLEANPVPPSERRMAEQDVFVRCVLCLCFLVCGGARGIST